MGVLPNILLSEIRKKTKIPPKNGFKILGLHHIYIIEAIFSLIFS